jgi:hypothetical protein
MLLVRQHVRPIRAGLGEYARSLFVNHVANCVQRPSEVRQQLEQAQMPVADAPDDDNVRQSYNFAPGYHGLVYRADGPEHGGQHGDEKEEVDTEGATGDTKYKLSSMQWGTSCVITRRRNAEHTRAGAVLD